MKLFQTTKRLYHIHLMMLQVWCWIFWDLVSMDIMMNHNPINPLVDFQLAKGKSKTETGLMVLPYKNLRFGWSRLSMRLPAPICFFCISSTVSSHTLLSTPRFWVIAQLASQFNPSPTTPKTKVTLPSWLPPSGMEARHGEATAMVQGENPMENPTFGSWHCVDFIPCNHPWSSMYKRVHISY